MPPPHLSLSSWTYHDPLYRGRLALSDIPGAARLLGFSAVELQDLFLWPRGHRLRRWLGQLEQALSPVPRPRLYSDHSLAPVQAALQRAGVRLAAWDLDTDFSRDWRPDQAGRLNGYHAPRASHRRTLAYAQIGLRAAWRLSAHVVRLTAGPLPAGAAPGSPEAARYRQQLVASFRYLARQAEACGLVLAVENHADALGDPDALLDFVLAVDRPNLGVCLDLGNFERGAELEGVRALAPHARHAHCKCWAFDAQGSETRLDYPQLLAELRAAGYQGTLSIEYEGDGDPNISAMRARALIEKGWR